MNEDYFKLSSDYKPKGDQPVAIKKLSEGFAGISYWLLSVHGLIIYFTS